ncbi:MAG: hypothetical protein ACW98W_17815 [Candidatus Hodarchaeales archaeon]
MTGKLTKSSAEHMALDIAPVFTLNNSHYSNPLLPFIYLLESDETYDLVLIFSDYDFNSMSLKLWDNYKNNRGKHAKLALIHFNPFCHYSIDVARDYYRLCGCDNNIINIILAINNWESIIERFRRL